MAATLDQLKAAAKSSYRYTMADGNEVLLGRPTHGFIRTLRDTYVKETTIEDYPAYKAAVVLAGMVEPALTEADLNDLTDPQIDELFTQIGQECGLLAKPATPPGAASPNSL